MTADPRKVSDLGCRCIAPELLGLQAPAFGWVHSELGAPSASAASAPMEPVYLSKGTHSRKDFATGTAKTFLSFLDPR